MIVYALIIVQNQPHTEHIDTLFSSKEAAENAARELEYMLPPGFEVEIEPFELQGEEDEL